MCLVKMTVIPDNLLVQGTITSNDDVTFKAHLFLESFGRVGPLAVQGALTVLEGATLGDLFSGNSVMVKTGGEMTPYSTII